MTISAKEVFATAATIVLSASLISQAAELPAPAGETNDDVSEMELPPPFTTEFGEDMTSATTYSLTGTDKVERLHVKRELFLKNTTIRETDIATYDFKEEKVRYFIFHTNGVESELTPIAIKPFWDVDPVELAHARVMGCKAALEKGLGKDNPYAEISRSYLNNYCPHP